jgi:hypothetical protein
MATSNAKSKSMATSSRNGRNTVAASKGGANGNAAKVNGTSLTKGITFYHSYSYKREDDVDGTVFFLSYWLVLFCVIHSFEMEPFHSIHSSSLSFISSSPSSMFLILLTWYDR